jgi:prophage regulatory protein
MKLISYAELKGKGIPYSFRHLQRLENQGKWPKRVAFSNHRKAWIEQEIDEHLRALIAARSSEAV